jgi:hypothetical protein
LNSETLDSTFLYSPFDINNNNHTNPNNDLFFDDDFLNVGLHDLISQTPPMDHLPDTPVPSVRPITTDNDEFQSSIEQLFSMPHEPMITPSPPIVQVISDATSKPSFTKCIVVTQDFLQSMYCQQQQQQHQQQNHSHQHSTMINHQFSSISRPKRRRRRLKVGKENSHQQRKLMPRTTSPDDHQ